MQQIISKIFFLLINVLFCFSLYAYPAADISLPYKTEIAWADRDYRRARILHDSGRYQEAINYDEKAVKKYKKHKKWKKYATTLRHIGFNYGKLNKFKQALSTLNLAEVTALKYLEENHSILADIYSNMGLVYRYQSDYLRALEYARKALAIQLKILGSRHYIVAGSYNNIGSIYRSTGDYLNALKYHQKALNIWLKTLGSDYYYLVIAYNNIGSDYWYQNDYSHALEYHKKALKVGLKMFKERPIIAIIYNHIGMSYQRTGDYFRALEYYKKALTVLKILRIRTNLADIYGNIGVVYEKTGDYFRALDYYQKTLAVKLKALGNNHPDVANTYNNIGIVYYDIGNYSRALEYYQKALAIWSPIFGENHPDVANTYNNIGGVYKKMSDYSQALTYYQKSLKIWIKTVGNRHFGVANAYNNIGLTYLSVCDYSRALEYHQKALNIRLKIVGENHADVASSYGNMGSIYDNQGNYEEALTFYQKAFGALVKGFNSSDICVNPPLRAISSKFEMLNQLTRKTLSAEKLYNQSQKPRLLHLAFETSLLAADLIDSMRNEYTPKAQQDLIKNSIGIYEAGIRTAFKLYQTTGKENYLKKAFSIAERSKAFLLLQNLQDAEAKHFAGISDSLLDLERDLKIQINFYQKQLFEAENKKDSTKTALYQNYLFENKRTYDSLINSFETDYPDYHRLKYDTRTASIEDVQKNIIDNHTALLEYFVGDSAVYAFTISQGDFHIEEIANSSEVRNEVKELLSLIKNHPKNLTDYQKIKVDEAKRVKLSRKLYKVLLSASLKKLKKNITRLVIVPDGMLNYLPFEALMTSGTKQQRYVLEDYAISYGYSATLLSEKLKTPIRTSEGEVLALAPRYPGNSKKLAVRGAINTLRSQPLSDLPGARKEIKSISSYFDGEFLFGKEANEANFKAQAERYKILHLAMHGQADAGSELGAKLLFTPTTSQTEDDTLYNYELYGLKLNADLIVLSACETGTGDLVRGEGVMSLARGFMYAGARSVVSSLWQTSDEASSKLMGYFYEQLSKGKGKDEALQAAKRGYLKSAKGSSDHPFYWAAFVPIGDMQPLSLKKDYSVLIWVLSGLGAFAISAFFYRQARKGSQKTK